MKIGFAGATHLGICHAIVAASKKNKVILFDEDNLIINNLKELKFNFFEPQLLELFKKFKKNIYFTSDIKKLNNSDIIYVSKDTPVNSKNKSDYTGIKKIIKKINNGISKKKILVILSQVYPGFTEKIKWNKNKLYYQVETLIFGLAIKRAMYPAQIIIGGYKLGRQDLLKKYLNQYNCPIKLMNYKSAELAKIAINLYLISSISFTNTLSEICEKIGADWYKIKNILYNDQRIGKKAYLNPGLGVLSANLQRDLQTSIKIQKKYNCKSDVLKSFDRNSRYRSEWVLKKLELVKKNDYIIGIYGLTYKENISFLTNSPALKVIKKFPNHQFLLNDPVVKKINLKSKNFNFEKDIKTFFKNIKILLLLTPWKWIKDEKNQKILNKYYKGKFIIDPYNIINKDLIKGSKVLSMGIKS